MADPQVNFFSSTLVGGYSDSDTSLTLATGSGANLPDPSVDGEFNLVIYNESEIFVTTTFDGGSTDTRQDLASTNPEIVRVTARTGDVITVTRAQEGTTASAKAAENTYRVILASTKKVFDDINTAIQNIDLTTIAGAESITFDSTGDEEFGLPAGTTAQRPSSPSAGYMRFNTDTKKLEIHTGGVWGLVLLDNVLELQTAQLSVTANDAVAENAPIEVEYLVIAGGGGGGKNIGAGGGAGGYRSSVSGESSGGGASAESALELDVSTNYTVTVGAGGNGGVTGSGFDAESGSSGSSSVFSTITSTGGGGGGGLAEGGLNGGSGGGGGGRGPASGGNGTTSQGFSGGDSSAGSGDAGAAGGGGATEEGFDSINSSGGNGGDGVSSSITGSSVTRAGGGGGGRDTGGGTGGDAGAGGGGAGSSTDGEAGGSGTSNTGGGGGGGGPVNGNGGNGGSGVVILRYLSDYTISIGAGLTGSETTVGANKVATITAGTGNVSWTLA